MAPKPKREGEVREYNRPVENMALPFDDSEYEDRVERTKERMTDRGIDVLITTDPANQYYLTGYRGWTFYTHQSTIVARDKEQPLMINREMDASSAKKTTWIDNDNVRYFSDEYVEGTNPFVFVAGLLDEFDWDDKTVGIDMSNYYFSGEDYQALSRELPDAELRNIDKLVNRVRLHKSDAEVEYIREAAEITANAHRAIRDSLGEGVRESEVAADAWHALIKGTDNYGGDYPAIAPLMGARHLTWSDGYYEDGATLSVELSGSCRRYHGPMSRTYYVGSPPDEVVETHEKLVGGLEVLLDAVEPGMTCEEVAQRYRDNVEYAPKASRHGYSFGVSFPPTWLEMSANIRPGDETVLEPNMTFHPILGAEFGTYQLSEPFVVTEDGAETLTDFPRELIVV